MKTRTVKGKFYAIEICIACGNPLSCQHLYYNSGICPHCGHSCSGTICDHNKRVYQEVRHQKKILGLFWWTVKRTAEWVNVED